MKLYFWTVCQLGLPQPQRHKSDGLTLWFLNLEELGDVDGLGISSGDHHGEVWAGYTTIVSLGTIDWRLHLDTDIECF